MGTHDSSAKDQRSAEAHQEAIDENAERSEQQSAGSAASGDAPGEASGFDAVSGVAQAESAYPEQSSTDMSREELAEALARAKRETEAHRDSVLRARAELENLRKRAQRDVENAHKYGLERLVAELLPAHDSMELGLKAAAERDVDIAAVREGVELTLKMFYAALEKHGVERIDPQGEPFNPDFHQAMSVQELEEVAPGMVTAVVQKGFTLNGRLIRPALVMVSK